MLLLVLLLVALLLVALVLADAGPATHATIAIAVVVGATCSRHPIQRLLLLVRLLWLFLLFLLPRSVLVASQRCCWRCYW